MAIVYESRKYPRFNGGNQYRFQYRCQNGHVTTDADSVKEQDTSDTRTTNLYCPICRASTYIRSSQR